MKFYVTGRSHSIERVKQAFAEIQERGHTVLFEWTALPMAKPYRDNQELAGTFAKDGIQGVVDADVYIIFLSTDGNGVYTEFGAALASHILRGAPKIYAVGGEEEKNSAMFAYHPAILYRKSVTEILDECH